MQVLFLVLVPPPHVAEHSDHSPNSVHPLSTEIVVMLTHSNDHFEIFMKICDCPLVSIIKMVKIGHDSKKMKVISNLHYRLKLQY